jgi:hypothetical protein
VFARIPILGAPGRSALAAIAALITTEASMSEVAGRFVPVIIFFAVYVDPNL